MLAGVLVSAALWAQFGGRGGGGYGRRFDPSLDDPRLDWPVEPAFKDDLFTFARLMYASDPGGRTSNGYYRGGGNSWTVDTPDADFNLAFRLHQMTSLRVRPKETDIPIDPAHLANFPFVYIVEPGSLVFRQSEVTALRDYLLNGGFLMVDDFWGDNQWDNLEEQLHRVFPGRKFVELDLSHPIFHTVFDLKQKPQMPAIEIYLNEGITWERHWGDYNKQTHDSHFYGIFDDKGRMMVFISFNNDFGDGWEREGDDPRYFTAFSEPQAYPMMINIIFYTMTH